MSRVVGKIRVEGGGTIVPTRLVGPIKFFSNAPESSELLSVPLATFETPLWFSVNRGAKISRAGSGINVLILKDCMTRSILLQAQDLSYAALVQHELLTKHVEFKKITKKTSSFIEFDNLSVQVIGNLMYLRFSFQTADASGHNMTTKAAEALQNWILQKYPRLSYISLSGNFCTDKKNSAVNSILGRGKHVVAEIVVPRDICLKYLRTTPEKIVELNIKKNLIGSIISGSVASANAHFANMLLAFYLATGQDAANIVEGSQGIVYAEVKDDNLYFSVTLPNIIVGTVGNGKDLPFAKENLKLLGCLKKRPAGENSRRLAAIAAITVLCGELSLLAALTNPDELMRGHLVLERK